MPTTGTGSVAVELLAFLAFAGIAVPAFLLLNRLLDPARGRLRRLARDFEGEGPRPLLPGRLVDALAPARPARRPDELAQLLRSAGYRSPNAAREYRALRLLLILLMAGGAGALGAVAPEPLLPSVVAGGVVAVLLAYSLPRAIVSVRARSRQAAISRGLPLAMDLLAVALASGLDPINSVRRVADAIRRAAPDLAEELREVTLVAQFQSMETGWRLLADRVPTEEARNLSSIMVQSERVGSDAALALTEFSANQRADARLRAEAQANRASFWMLFPTITCFFIASAIVLMGPVLFQFTTPNEATRAAIDIQKESTDRIRDFRASPDSPPAQP